MRPQGRSSTRSGPAGPAPHEHMPALCKRSGPMLLNDRVPVEMQLCRATGVELYLLTRPDRPLLARVGFFELEGWIVRQEGPHKEFWLFPTPGVTEVMDKICTVWKGADTDRKGICLRCEMADQLRVKLTTHTQSLREYLEFGMSQVVEEQEDYDSEGEEEENLLCRPCACCGGAVNMGNCTSGCTAQDQLVLCSGTAGCRGRRRSHLGKRKNEDAMEALKSGPIAPA